jgi:ribosomal protein S1
VLFRSIKQLDGDPFATFTTLNDRGATVTGKVKTVDARGAEIQLTDDVTGYLRASEISRDRVEDARNVLKEGDEVTALIINVDRKTRSIQLSIKAKDNVDNQEAMQRLAQTSERENAGTTSLGALLRPSWTRTTPESRRGWRPRGVSSLHACPCPRGHARRPQCPDPGQRTPHLS